MALRKIVRHMKEAVFPRRKRASSPVPTGIPWLDEAVESSRFRMTDSEAAREIYIRITGVTMSAHTFRRLPIPYRLYHRTRQYELGHVIEAADRRVAETPLRRPALRRAKPAIGTTLHTSAPPAPSSQRRSARWVLFVRR